MKVFPKLARALQNSQSPNDAEDSAVIEDSMGQDDCFVGLVSDLCAGEAQVCSGVYVAITSGPSVAPQ
jgi:hypothetical protein